MLEKVKEYLLQSKMIFQLGAFPQSGAYWVQKIIFYVDKTGDGRGSFFLYSQPFQWVPTMRAGPINVVPLHCGATSSCELSWQKHKKIPNPLFYIYLEKMGGFGVGLATLRETAYIWQKSCSSFRKAFATAMRLWKSRDFTNKFMDFFLTLYWHRTDLL